MRRIAATLPDHPNANKASTEHQLAVLCAAKLGQWPDPQPCITMRNSSRERLKPVFVLALAAQLVLVAGCEQSESVQTGLRGSSSVQFYKPSQLAKLREINEIPAPEPSDPYDPSFPMATEIHQNVQVLTDLNALEFARLMNAISTWVAPNEGCAYCHDPADLASDEKFTKIVSREMLKMTRSINTKWKSHVLETGVTCWTCHRGQAIPSDIWFKAPEPETPSAGVSGWKGGQNVAGVGINGNTSLPFDPLTPFLDQANQIAVQGTEALPYGNRSSIKQAEWTYSLMMYMSKSLGVNCTYCHHTRAMGVWDQSTPQRLTAWHGIRMVRDLNESYLSLLKPLYPKDRLGPEGDAPKTACATCHKGTYKPLFGQSMLQDYPSLAGVLPGRLDAETEAAAIKALSRVSPEIVALTPADPPEITAPVIATTTAKLPTAQDEPEASNDKVAPLLSSLSFWQASKQLAQAEVKLQNGSVANPTDVSATSSTEAAPLASAPPATPKIAGDQPTSTETRAKAEPAESQSDKRAPTQAQLTAMQARLEQERLALQQQLEVVREQRDQIASEVKAQLTGQHDDELAAVEKDLQATEARLEQERTALQQQLEVVRKQRHEAQASAKVKIDPKQHEAKLDAAETRIRAARAQLDQQQHALQQQLALVREQRDEAQAQAEQQINDLHVLHQQALDEQSQQVAALEVRLEQNLIALNQQLAVVRSQRDAAFAQAEDRIATLIDEHEDAIETKRQRLAAMQARLDQNRHALEQQLAVARSQGTEEATKARLAELQEAHDIKVAELQREIQQTEGRLRDEQDRLQQQLAIAREERDALVLESKDNIAELEQLRLQMAKVESDHAEALAEAEGSVTRIRLQPQDAEDIGGRLTDEGILVNLGSDELRFASGSAALPTQQLPTLDRTAALLAARPELSARIEGHTDSVGSTSINQSLSQQRAEAVRQALIERGIDPQRLAARGAGADQPIADNGTPEGRRQNRRVEIYLTAEDEISTADDMSGSG